MNNQKPAIERKFQLLSPGRKQYLDLKSQHQDAILLFRMGDFYETFDEDAQIASRLLGIALTSRSMSKEEGKIPLAGVPHHQLERYLDLLISAGHRVAIAEQTSIPPSQGGSTGLVDRAVTRIVTPGTVDTGALMTSGSNNWLVALVPSQGNNSLNWGLAAVDVTTGEFQVLEIAETHLSGELTRIRPREIIFPEGTKNNLIQLIPSAVLKTVRPLAEFDTKKAEAHWSSLLHIETTGSLGLTKHPLALSASGAILAYLEDVWPDIKHTIRPPRLGATSDYIFLDSQTRTSLDLFGSTGRENESLISTLDQSSTHMGKRLLEERLSRPSRDRREIESRLDQVQEFVNDSLLRKNVQRHLKQLPDLERLVTRIRSGASNTKHLAQLRDALLVIPILKDSLQSANPNLSDSIKNIDPCQELCNELDTQLTQVPPTGPGSEPSIKQGINPEIDDHRSFLESVFLKLADLEKSERARTGLAIKVGYNRVFGYYLECPRGQASQAPDDYEPRQTLANAQRFRFLPLTALEKDISVTQGLLVNLEHDVIAELLKLVSKYEAKLSRISNAVAVVDVATGLAEIAERNSYCRPIFNHKNKIEIQSGRHPVVENSMSAGEFIPNNTHLGPPAEKIILLTGPNMAGKSTYLRQLAIIVLMAHCGSFVPAKSANLPVIDRIFSRVGAQDEIAAGRSTFMVEMTETATILNNCTQDSLVIFDEVGRGTSTEDGLAIAQAVIEFLYDNDKGCPLTVFATHYRELTNITAHLDGVINRSVAVSNEDGVITFLHRIVNGSADSSYGVHVASLAGIPKEVIERAQLLLETPHVEQKPYATINKHSSKPEKQQLPEDLEAMIRKLKRIAPDSLTPREALEKLYELHDEAEQL